MSHKILRKAEVLQKIGIKNSTLYAWIAAGIFPRQISLGGARAVGWLACEIDDFIAAQVEKSRASLNVKNGGGDVR